ncbi:MAG: antitoxin component YwqK of YwqJK toxin-antitoxin module [Patiriisocius sp.]|jgi:antitoxin component YwqK of YwqJK toxin-antitoxin module
MRRNRISKYLLKKIGLTFSLLLICTLSFGQRKKSTPVKIDQIALKKYQKFLDEGAELISINDFQSIERIEKGKYLRKTYNPDKITLSTIIGFKDLIQRKVTGSFKDFYDNGNKWSEGHYKEFLKHGEWKYYHYPGGQLASSGPYEYNKKHGDWKYLDVEGHVVKTCEFNEGKLKGEVLYYNQHKEVVYKELYKRGEKKGTEIILEEEYAKIDSESTIFPTLLECEDDVKSTSKCLKKETRDFFKQNSTLGAKAKSLEVFGRVFLKFEINNQGDIKHTEILRGFSKEMEIATLDAMQNFPKFKPWSIEDGSSSISFMLVLDFGDELMEQNSGPNLTMLLWSDLTTVLAIQIMNELTSSLYYTKSKDHFIIPVRM